MVNKWEDPYVGYYKNFPFPVFSSSKSSTDSSKSLCPVAFLIKMSLYYPITNSNYQVQTSQCGTQGPPASGQNPLQPKWIFNVYVYFLTLHLPKIASLGLSVHLSSCFPSHKTFNTCLYHLPSILPRYVTCICKLWPHIRNYKEQLQYSRYSISIRQWWWQMSSFPYNL